MTDAPHVRWTDNGEERSVSANEVRTMMPRVHRDNEEGAVLVLRREVDVWIPQAAVAEVDRQIQTYRAAGLMPRYIPFSQ